MVLVNFFLSDYSPPTLIYAKYLTSIFLLNFKAGFVVQLETVAEEADIEHQSPANPNIRMPSTHSSDANLEPAYLHLSLRTPTLGADQFLITEVQYVNEDGDETEECANEPVRESADLKEPAITPTEDLMRVDLGAGDSLEVDILNSSIETDLNSDLEDKGAYFYLNHFFFLYRNSVAAFLAFCLSEDTYNGESKVLQYFSTKI